MNILNSRFDHFENETANKLSKLDILETINNRMETIEKGLSNLQNEVIVVKTKLSEPTDDELFFTTASVFSPISCGMPSKIKLYFMECDWSLIRSSYKDSFSRSRCFRSSSVGSLSLVFTTITSFCKLLKRGIIARFSRYEDYERVRNAVPNKLKGTTYSVYQQYLKEIAGRRRDLVPKIKQYKRQGRQAKMFYDRLIVDDVYFFVAKLYPSGKS
jgi:hypothetical protein